MNRKQYSEIQHCLGVLEGLGTALRGTAVDLFNATLARLSGIINELAPTVDQPEAGQGEGASNQADDDPPQLWIKYDGDLALSTSKPCGYAYGPKWVAQALRMDDICFETPAAAKAAWEAGIGNKEGSPRWICSPEANREREEEGVTVDAGNGTAISNCSTRYDPDTPSTPTTPLGWQNEYRRPANAET